MHSSGKSPQTQDNGATLHWYALSTRHQHERTAARYLSICGHNIFLPLYSAVHKWQDRNKRLSLPLFPGYLFIQGGLDRQTQILNAPGVASIIAWSGRPAIISQAEIDVVRHLVDSTLRVEPHDYLSCGERVKIKDGALQGIEGILIRKKNLFRLVVSMELLGRAAAVEVDLMSVERVHPVGVSMTAR